MCYMDYIGLLRDSLKVDKDVDKYNPPPSNRHEIQTQRWRNVESTHLTVAQHFINVGHT